MWDKANNQSIISENSSYNDIDFSLKTFNTINISVRKAFTNYSIQDALNDDPSHPGMLSLRQLKFPHHIVFP